MSGGRHWQYILNGHDPVPCYDHVAFAFWYADLSKRRVALDYIESDAGDRVEISTVFIALDTEFAGPPMLFETQIFGGMHDGWRCLYATWDEAERTHKLIVQLVRTVEVLDTQSDSAMFAVRELERIRRKPL